MPLAIAAIRRCLLKELKLYCFWIQIDCTYAIIDNQHWPAFPLRGHALSDDMSSKYSKERAQQMALVVVSRIVAVEAR
jgi:hypothetical protein